MNSNNVEGLILSSDIYSEIMSDNRRYKIKKMNKKQWLSLVKRKLYLLNEAHFFLKNDKRGRDLWISCIKKLYRNLDELVSRVDELFNMEDNANGIS